MATVFVIDDKRSIRRTLSVLLQGAGHSVLAAEGVDEAIQALETTPVNAVVSDLLMPEGSGLDVLRHNPLPGSTVEVRLPALGKGKRMRGQLPSAALDCGVQVP